MLSREQRGLTRTGIQLGEKDLNVTFQIAQGTLAKNSEDLVKSMSRDHFKSVVSDQSARKLLKA